MENRTVGVLHVDDDPAMLEIVVAFLERLDVDAQVRSAADAADALEVLQSEPETVDVVVSDFSLPDDGGIAFLEAAQAEQPDLPFIFFTGRVDGEEAAVAHGATDYIVKGNAERLNELVHRIVAAVEPGDERQEAEPSS